MKIVFEGTYAEICREMREMLLTPRQAVTPVVAKAPEEPKIIPEDVSEKGHPERDTVEQVASEPQGSSPEAPKKRAHRRTKPVENASPPVDSPVDKKRAKAEVEVEVEAEAEEPEAGDAADAIKAATDAVKKNAAAKGNAAAMPGPAEVAAIKARTVEDLQTAFANGKQKQVFDILAKYGDGAKSFRELSMDAFLPIREAIDAGELA